ncbi:MAG: hypothetical protein JNJ46_30560 [Myxococcales bacterium]|nr:hypothetical protein [Myxococcales bacterium]
MQRRKENRVLRMERELLIKATAFFAKDRRMRSGVKFTFSQAQHPGPARLP